METGKRLLKQIETANICLNVERDCISVILDPPPRQKLDPTPTPLGESPGFVPEYHDLIVYKLSVLYIESFCYQFVKK